MNYLLYGTEKFLINKELKNIIEKYKIDDINISKYDLTYNTLDEIIDDANTISLFNEKKLIIVDNSYIFNRVQQKKLDDTILIQYLENSNVSTILIFVDYNEKIDSVKKIVKIIKANGYIKEYNQLKSIYNNVLMLFEGYKINEETVNLFIKRVGNNLEILYQEAEKLKLYKLEEKEINKDDIINATIESISVDVFKFVEDIINKNKKDAINTYNEMLKLNEEPIKIVALLASKFRLAYQASSLTKKGYTEDDISNILGVHRYPVHLAILLGYKYNPNILLKYLNKLADLDIGMKNGEKDKKLALELFILSL